MFQFKHKASTTATAKQQEETAAGSCRIYARAWMGTKFSVFFQQPILHAFKKNTLKS